MIYVKKLIYINKIVSVVTNMLFYIFLAGFIAFLLLLLCGIRPYITMSGSMDPAVPTGSMCLVDTNANYAEMEEGDIIAFRTALGGLVTHRVIDVTGEGLVTKGDANEMSDGVSTTPNNFYGQTIFSIPYLGYCVKFLQQPYIMVCAAILAVGFFLLSLINRDTQKRPADESSESSTYPENNNSDC